ncbi:MAG: FadR family transcriptional regulator [Blautia sp.]|nr:FadR family transcriptional regulator [Blautia sp.]
MADNFAKLNRTLISSQVEDQMMDYLFRECSIGDKLPNEFELARRFGTSRTTIREIMKSLAAQGLVEIKHGSGTYVLATSPVISDPLNLSGRKDKYRLALELFDVRLMLEPEIAAKAAEDRTDVQAEEVMKYCEEVEQLYTSGMDHAKKDIAFHTSIARCSGNMVVQTLVPIIQSAVVTFCNVTERKLMNETIYTHKAIAKAIYYRDPIGARCSMTAHLSVNRDLIQDLIRERQ